MDELKYHMRKARLWKKFGKWNPITTTTDA